MKEIIKYWFKWFCRFGGVAIAILLLNGLIQFNFHEILYVIKAIVSVGAGFATMLTILWYKLGKGDI